MKKGSRSLDLLEIKDELAVAISNLRTQASQENDFEKRNTLRKAINSMLGAFEDLERAESLLIG